MQIFTLTIPLTHSVQRGNNFQLADTVHEMATAIWDMVFPALELGAKRTKNYELCF